MSEKVGSVKGTQLDEEFQELEKVNRSMQSLNVIDFECHVLLRPTNYTC